MDRGRRPNGRFLSLSSRATFSRAGPPRAGETLQQGEVEEERVKEADGGYCMSADGTDPHMGCTVKASLYLDASCRRSWWCSFFLCCLLACLVLAFEQQP